MLTTDSAKPAIYVASRVARAPMWRDLRDHGWPISSSWIDEDGEGETGDFGELWLRIQREIAACTGLIFYGAVADAPWKGALLEVGMALAMGKPVYAVIVGDLDGRTQRPIGSWLAHPQVVRGTLAQALKALYNGNTGTAQANTEAPKSEASRALQDSAPDHVHVAWNGLGDAMVIPGASMDAVTYYKAPPPLRSADAKAPVNVGAYPDSCPFTGQPFFMVIEHPSLGWVPTYGGPFDSYTIPQSDTAAPCSHDDREFYRHRYDHDRGGWVDDESISLRIIEEGDLYLLEDARDALVKARSALDELALMQLPASNFSGTRTLRAWQTAATVAEECREVLAKQRVRPASPPADK